MVALGPSQVVLVFDSLALPPDPRGDLPTMSTPWLLHHLRTLDTSSLDFLRYLHCLIRHDEEDQYLTSLQGSQLTELVDFLDHVRALPSTFCPLTKRGLQTLNVISANDGVSQQCLHKLQAICGHYTILPSSYIASGKISRLGDGPIALSAIADVWGGTHDGKKVTIKCFRVPLSDKQAFKKVRVLYGIFHRVHSGIPVDAAVILQRGRRLEKVETPEYRPFHRC